MKFRHYVDYIFLQKILISSLSCLIFTSAHATPPHTKKTHILNYLILDTLLSSSVAQNVILSILKKKLIFLS